MVWWHTIIHIFSSVDIDRTHTAAFFARTLFLSVRQNFLEVQPQLHVGAPWSEHLVRLMIDPAVVRLAARMVVKQADPRLVTSRLRKLAKSANLVGYVFVPVSLLQQRSPRVRLHAVAMAGPSPALSVRFDHRSIRSQHRRGG